MSTAKASSAAIGSELGAKVRVAGREIAETTDEPLRVQAMNWPRKAGYFQFGTGLAFRRPVGPGEGVLASLALRRMVGEPPGPNPFARTPTSGGVSYRLPPAP
jgi:hypothetical protein